VDNMWDRGRTIVTVASRIKSAGGFPETAVLHWKKNRSLFKDDEPDYYAAITDDWVYYPWQRIDDSGDMVPTGPRVPQLS
jgi:hypoxanthine phosphoribosyltransferase